MPQPPTQIPLTPTPPSKQTREAVEAHQPALDSWLGDALATPTRIPSKPSEKAVHTIALQVILPSACAHMAASFR